MKQPVVGVYGGRYLVRVLIKAHHNNLPRGCFWGMAAPRDVDVGQLVKKIEESQYGFDSTLQGPFGAKRGESRSATQTITLPNSQIIIFIDISLLAVVYTDYTASGKLVVVIHVVVLYDVDQPLSIIFLLYSDL